MRKNTKPTVLILLLLLITPLICSTTNAQSMEMKRVEGEKLIEDARALASYIESIHPEPYGECGGKIAFHRRFQQILQVKYLFQFSQLI